MVPAGGFMGECLRIGTRGSRLALAQAESVASRLRDAWPALDVHIETVRTEGDRDRRASLSSASGRPGVGFFVKELEAALLEKRIDLAVHSMKDVPTHPPHGLEVEAAVPARADPRDCLITREGLSLDELPEGAAVGTSSTRRRAMLLAARPDLAFVDLRGNVETRLRKLEAGTCDAAVLAQAGVGRLGILDGRMVVLKPSVMLPAAGQGALGLEFRSEEETVRRWIGPLDDPPSRLAVACERALVRRLGAGCRTALGVLATVDQSGGLMLDVWLLSPTGQEALRRRAEGPAEGPESIGSHLAEQLLEAGAARLMATESGEADA